MKNLSKTLVGAATLILAGQVYAQAQQDCLPSSVVASTTFTKAIQDPNPQQSTIWAMISDKLNYQQKDWNVVFVAVLKNANSQSEALTEGQAYFKSIQVSDPVAEVYGNQIFCEYGAVEDQYVVLAASPPLSIDTSMGIASKKFK